MQLMQQVDTGKGGWLMDLTSVSVTFNRVAQKDDKRQTDGAGAATTSGRGHDQAEQHQSLRGELRAGSAQLPGEEGMTLRSEYMAGWGLRPLGHLRTESGYPAASKG